MSDPSANIYAAEMAAYATSLEADEPYDTVHLDGLPIPVHGDIGYVNLGVFAPKFTIGDPSKDSDNLLSVWTEDDWTGGGQVENLNEGSDTQRFRHATAETRYPNMLTLPLETVAYTIAGAGPAYPIGDYKPGAIILFWVAFGTSLRSWDAATHTFIGAATIAATPVNKGVVYAGKLYIPQGATGYDTWDGTTVVHTATITAVAFLEWDDKLVALEDDGQLSIWDGATWTSTASCKLKGDRIPRNLVLWFDPNRNPTIFIVTSRDVWVYDPLIPRVYRTGLNFPGHPDQGLGSCAWRDDAMYISVGVGIHQLSLGGVVSAMGLDRNDGLPADLRGAVVDLEPEYNGMMALVKGIGDTIVGATTQVLPTIEETTIYDAAMVVPTASTSARSTLQRWTGLGWHTVWESVGSTGTPTRVQVSIAADEYRLWWGYGASMYTQPLRRTFHNPKQGAQLGIDRFAPSAYFLSGRFDANMSGFHKLASHIDARMDDGSTGTIDISYQTDRSVPAWRALGTLSVPGKSILGFDPDEDGWIEGQEFGWIEYRFDFTRTNDPTQTPILNWFSTKLIKEPLLTRSWTLNVPLRFPDNWMGKGARETADALDAMIASSRFITFKHRDRVYRVRVAQIQGPEGTGRNLMSDRRVSLIEVDPANEQRWGTL